MAEEFYRMTLGVLLVWRVTHLLANEDGPADSIVRFRKLLGQSLAGQLMDCFNCLSLWVAAPAALFVSRKPVEWFVTWLALSGGTCLLERLGHDHGMIQPVSETQEGDVDHVLRPETSGPENQHGNNEGTESFTERTR